MARRGEASRAHAYDERDCCIHCGMYRNNVEQINHVCKQWREDQVDQEDLLKSKVKQSIFDWRRKVDGK
jgi:hypothetical protein